MVTDDGQLYTIEGVAASVLILTTVYLVLSSTTVLTPGETHIYDMQLEQLGNDVLAVMDLSPTWTGGSDSYPKSPLETYIEQDQADYFTDNFTRYCNMTTGEMIDNLQFNATIFFRDENDGDRVKSIPFAKTTDYNRENAVKVSRWVSITNASVDGGGARNQTVLLEVLLWRG